MSIMTTLSEVLNNLKEQGYTADFNLQDNCLICHGNPLQLHPEDFVVDRHYRFEGDTDPGDEAIVYAISSDKHNLKGTLVNGYGIYSDGVSDKMMAALRDRSGENSDAVRTISEKPKEISPINAIDLPYQLRQLMQDKSWEDKDQKVVNVCKINGLSISLIALRKNAELKTHTAPGSISVQLLEGRINFCTGDHSVNLTVGQIVALEANVPHSVFASEYSVFMLTMHLVK